jgi:hypothetical protein
MSQMNLLNLKSESSYLEKLISESPPNAVIGRRSLTARLQKVQQEIKELKNIPHPLIQGTISFRGKPVVDCHGIGAAFGTEAVKKFETIVAAKAASFLTPLSVAGKLPNRDQYRLIITGTVRGSFGFEFENHVDDNEFPCCQETSSYLEDAINEIVEFFESINDTDEKLADTLVETDTRVVNEVTNFLELLAKSEATCGLEFGTHSFCFKDVAEVRNSLQRLHKDNIHEENKIISGCFIGVLPHKRIFEFSTDSDNKILSGKISKNIEDPATINSLIKTPINIEVHITQVGSSKPKYLLTKMSNPISISENQVHTSTLFNKRATEKELVLVERCDE